MTMLSLIILPYEIISLMPSMYLSFTMWRPPYIGFERPNHLRYSWDKLRNFLHQLWILPKIQPWPQVRIKLNLEMRGSFPWFSSTVQNSLKQARTPSKWGTECCNAPPKEGREHRHSLIVGRGVLAFKNEFWVFFSMVKYLYSLSCDFSFLN